MSFTPDNIADITLAKIIYDFTLIRQIPEASDLIGLKVKGDAPLEKQEYNAIFQKSLSVVNNDILHIMSMLTINEKERPRHDEQINTILAFCIEKLFTTPINKKLKFGPFIIHVVSEAEKK
jgi:hypothetical protein